MQGVFTKSIFSMAEATAGQSTRESRRGSLDVLEDDFLPRQTADQTEAELALRLDSAEQVGFRSSWKFSEPSAAGSNSQLRWARLHVRSPIVASFAV